MIKDGVEIGIKRFIALSGVRGQGQII